MSFDFKSPAFHVASATEGLHFIFFISKRNREFKLDVAILQASTLSDNIRYKILKVL